MGVLRHRTKGWVALPQTILTLAFVALFGACQPAEEESRSDAPEVKPDTRPLVVYSGRNKSLIEPLLTRFEEATGIRTEVRYGGTAEMAATLLEEGQASPCDVFIAQDAAALGRVSAAGLLRRLPSELYEQLPVPFTSHNGDWVGLSGRARVVVYNTERISSEDLPQSLEAVADPKYRGRFGVAPVNGSFQAHMAAYGSVHGAEALGKLLAGMEANDPGRYPKNSAIVEAVLQGEIDWGLTNHYYLWRALKESPDAPGANFFMPEGQISAFLNLAGAGLVSDRSEARRLLEFLLAEESQRYFAEETFEYPLIPSVEPSPGLKPLPDIDWVDFAKVSEHLEGTLEAISASGLVQ